LAGRPQRHHRRKKSRVPNVGFNPLGEFLATHNDPCYFHEFATRAAGQGLAYLGETELRSSLPEAMPAETGGLIRKIAGDDGLALEQYMDFFGGRQFRRSLLVRADQRARVSRAIRADRLTGLHLASSLREGAPEKAGDPIPFADEGARLMVCDPLSLGLYRFLQAAWPDTRTPDEIRNHLVQAGVLRGDSASADFLRFLMSPVVGGTVRIARQVRRLGRADDPRPEIWPMARLQLAQEQPWVASQLHKVVKIKDDNARFLALVDGTRDHAALAATLADMLLDGRLKSDLPDGVGRDQLLPECQRLVQQSLDLCQRQAILKSDDS
ncbi:methyltransferase regulatory domain-containing protein, partial [Mesobacterium sp. TK19101]